MLLLCTVPETTLILITQTQCVFHWGIQSQGWVHDEGTRHGLTGCLSHSLWPRRVRAENCNCSILYRFTLLKSVNLSFCNSICCIQLKFFSSSCYPLKQVNFCITMLEMPRCSSSAGVGVIAQHWLLCPARQCWSLLAHLFPVSQATKIQQWGFLLKNKRPGSHF